MNKHKKMISWQFIFILHVIVGVGVMYVSLLELIITNNIILIIPVIIGVVILVSGIKIKEDVKV